MLDIQLFRQNAEAVRIGLKKVGQDPDVVDTALALDSRRRELQQIGDEIRAKMNVASKAIGMEKDAEREQH